MAKQLSEICYLKGVGEKRAEILQKEFGIETIEDVLNFFPFRYVDKSSFTAICSITPGTTTYVQVLARVRSIELFSKTTGRVFAFQFEGNKPPQIPKDIKFNLISRMRVIVEDLTGSLELMFFKGIKWTFAKLSQGGSYVFFGRPSDFNGGVNMVHPEVDAAPYLMEDAPNQPASLGKLEGVYPSTEKAKTAGITSKVMAKIVQAAFDKCYERGPIPESLPEYLVRHLELMSRGAALYAIHFPKSMRAVEQASYRLKFEELFLLQLSLLKQKYVNTNSSNGLMMPKVGEGFNDCFKALPFPLTGAQKKVIKEIKSDITSGHQMNRLLQGDVGSGKTIVAILSCLLAVDSGYQACIMAPTEVLAQQHYRNLQKYLAPTKVTCALLTGSTKQKDRREIHKNLEAGTLNIIVGTHALIEDKVLFKNLGFVVIDEQHRFGVEQRSKLWSKGADPAFPPHVLVMTATPIPRTLAMTLYGDLDVSVIDELPPGRTPVKTIHATEGDRTKMYNFVKDQIALGRQAFIVYPLIYENETLDLQNLEKGYEQVTEIFPIPKYEVAMVHGQQSNEDKQYFMDAFARGAANILVSTTVIEVGVDVPNASVMIIENANRFGLSQLHQLRGRVGRGAAKSYCILMHETKIGDDARKKIEIMCRTENGFEIAEEDMRLRGPGDLDGTKQSGLPIDLKIASLAKDGEILSRARDVAEKVLKADPNLLKFENNLLSLQVKNIKSYSKIS